MESERSTLEKERSLYLPRLPQVLAAGIRSLSVTETASTPGSRDSEELRVRFPGIHGQPILELAPGAGPVEAGPLKVGVVLSGGQAPGGHNVITGLFDALCGLDRTSKLYGFLGGPKGIFTERVEELIGSRIDPFRNTGGFDLIGSGRDKIETDEQFAACRRVCEKLALDGLVIVGGDDSNTNAALLAEYFVERDVPVTVVGVPKTIDGDLKGEYVETSFGFDTATKLYSELIGNISRDARSAAKYWHFVKLMGRSASHVTLECALATRANIALIGEEVAKKGMTLAQVVDGVAEVIRCRAAVGRHYGICLVAEGLIEFIPEMRGLIDELNTILAEGDRGAGTAPEEERIAKRLQSGSREVFLGLPPLIRRQLLLDRDSHGNVQVSKIDTEQLLIEQVRARLEELRTAGTFDGKFQVQPHFLGYEGRCAAPSNFDADYTYGLGTVAAALIAFRKTGYLCAIGNLVASSDDWRARGVPLTSMMQIESRKGRPTPVIARALVDLDGAPFRAFAAAREAWQVEDHYLYPGPIQYFGPTQIADARTRTLHLERDPGR